MPDVFLYPGEANPDDVKLRDPTTSSGTPAITGTGALTLVGPAVVGSGKETFRGTGAPALVGPAVSGSGKETFRATGALALVGPTIAGSGKETFRGTGAATLVGPAVAGTGTETFRGTGDLTIPLVIDGVGSVPVVAQPPTSAAHVSGPAMHRRVYIRGAGAIVLPAVKIHASGETTESDDWLLALPSAELVGV